MLVVNKNLENHAYDCCGYTIYHESDFRIECWGYSI